jgi:hypothetical protein
LIINNSKDIFSWENMFWEVATCVLYKIIYGKQNEMWKVHFIILL